MEFRNLEDGKESYDIIIIIKNIIIKNNIFL